MSESQAMDDAFQAEAENARLRTEVKLLRDAIDKSNAALEEAVNWKHLMTLQLSTSERLRKELNLQAEEMRELLRQADDLYSGYGLICGPIKDFPKYEGKVQQGEWIGKVRKITRAAKKPSCEHEYVYHESESSYRCENCGDISATGVSKKRKDECTLNCMERWPDMGHHPECPTRKCKKHGLTVCDECAEKRSRFCNKPYKATGSNVQVHCWRPFGHDGGCS